MPPAVQADLVSQLEQLSQESSVNETRSTVYELAMCAFSGFGNDNTLFSGVLLSEVEDLLRGLDFINLDVEHLECIHSANSVECSPQWDALDRPVWRGLLIRVACRVGILPLVKFLLELSPPTPG